MKLRYKILSILLVFSILTSCGSKENKAVEAHHDEEEAHENEVSLTPEQFKVANIQLGLVSEKALSGTIRVNGLLDLPPQSKVSLSTPFAGILKSTNMLQGKKVRKGEAVAVLEHPDYIEVQQSYLELKSQSNYAKADFERQQELAKEQVNAQKSLQKAESDYQILMAKFNAVKSKLKLMNINISNLDKGNLTNTITLYSPINGYITTVNKNIGAMVNSNDVILEIADTEHLHAELTVYEKDVPKLKIGQKVRFVLANEQKERMATVYLIGKEISAERTINIHCHLDEEDAHLIPGMYLQALVESGVKKMLSLPEDAIVDFEGDKYVFVAQTSENKNEHRFKMLKVNLGVAELGYVAIEIPELKDIQNEQFVLKGAYDLLSQLKNREEEEEGGHGH
ncbi:efflux RND transporter periplasmic adaptor subunit [Pedobacter alpinus]|uniref:Efflux RND transporter periplasmic adaptor subunit n=1 Tax=Pedobacter alpinus TaxID=1590643 RepID=A0ABW5TM21_9SPHI